MKYKLGEKHKELNLYRVVYLRDIPQYGVKSGDVGGWIASEHNLSQDDDCVVLDEAMVYGNARIFGNAWIFEKAKISGNARIYNSAWVFGDAKIGANIRINYGCYDVAPTLINKLKSIAKLSQK